MSWITGTAWGRQQLGFILSFKHLFNRNQVIALSRWRKGCCEHELVLPRPHIVFPTLDMRLLGLILHFFNYFLLLQQRFDTI